MDKNKDGEQNSGGSQDMYGNQLGKAFDVMDMVLSGTNKFQTIQSIWKYAVSLD